MPRAGSTRPKVREVRERLTRERIARAALEMIDAGGLEGLSMRALGAQLGVEAMALYHYFDKKGALLDAVTELLLEECAAPGPEAGTPMQRIEAALRSYRQVSIRHPRAFELLTTRRFSTPRAFAYYERILAPYFELGFDASMAARLFRLGGYFVGGAGHAEIASRALAADSTPVVLERSRAGLKRVLAPKSRSKPAFPRVARVAPHLRVDNLDAVFEFGLSVVLEATRRAERRGPPPRRPRSARRAG
ncbi:MAG: TetR/AcrR family transcriptional regulator C-terminal domain-containing protein [Polyangiaceae bacterium]